MKAIFIRLYLITLNVINKLNTISQSNFNCLFDSLFLLKK